MSTKWKVHKFGGTSVLNAERIKNVFHILNSEKSKTPAAVVVSAMKGVTDDLLRLVEQAQSHSADYQQGLSKIEQRHFEAVDQLLGPRAASSADQNALKQILRNDFKELQEILRGVWLVKSASRNITDLVSGMGEVWSAQLLAAFAQQSGVKATWLDARKILVVRHSPTQVVIDWPKTKEKFAAWLKQNTAEFVAITGFVAATEDGTITTLGRNGSDFSGSIFGALFPCDEVLIWTDVDGVMSADPRLVPEAVVLKEMSYNEVSELAFFGAKVVHPSTMGPVVDKKIPLWIKNTFNPHFPGTKIHADAKSDQPVRGFSSIENMCLLNVEGPGMVGIPGVAERLFSALRAAGVNIVLISQASSEHSICFAVSAAQAGVATSAVQEAFRYEMQTGLIGDVHVTKDVSILAVVGDNMARTPGISGRFFTALGRAGVNIRAIAQGSSERNISAVIDAKDSQKALRTVHSAFVLPHLSLAVGLIGVGSIGSTFLRQVNAQLTELKEQRKVDVQILAIADSKKMWLSATPIPLTDWQTAFAENAELMDLAKWTAHFKNTHVPHSVIIDSTASSALTPEYSKWLKAGLHIVTPNKKANSDAMKDYLEIRAAAKKSSRHFLYSTNVGAGLPIIQTLRDLYTTGDGIQLIQGIFSGTLSFLFNEYTGERAFSEIVKEAKAKGYTEPDPREDLSGQDVMRKLVILAREAGLSIEASDVKVEGLVPANLLSLSKDEFMQRLPEMDSIMQEKLKAAKAAGQVLRFVGSLDIDGQVKVGLEALPNNHAFAYVTGTDNIVLFKTKRYSAQPLVVRGPGAGPEVTAAGVFADLLRLSQYLGAVL